MSTLHRIRGFALVTVMATGALIASATQADKVRTSERVDTVGIYADLGHMTVTGGGVLSAFPTRVSQTLARSP